MDGSTQSFVYIRAENPSLRSLALPLDVASDGGVLIFGDEAACENQINGSAQVFSGNRRIGARAAGVELAAIDEQKIGVEEKEIRCAGGFVRMGRFLGFVV